MGPPNKKGMVNPWMSTHGQSLIVQKKCDLLLVAAYFHGFTWFHPHMLHPAVVALYISVSIYNIL